VFDELQPSDWDRKVEHDLIVPPRAGRSFRWSFRLP
jgi:hypothetical protein